MSNRAPSMNTVHPSVDPRGGIYPAEMIRYGAIKKQEAENNVKEHHTGEDGAC